MTLARRAPLPSCAGGFGGAGTACVAAAVTAAPAEACTRRAVTPHGQQSYHVVVTRLAQGAPARF